MPPKQVSLEEGWWGIAGQVFSHHHNSSWSELDADTEDSSQVCKSHLAHFIGSLGEGGRLSVS